MNPVHYCPELEAQILGHLMYIGTHDDLRVQNAMLRVTTKSFYKAINAHIFVLISQAFRKEEPFGFVDILVLIGKQDNDLHQHLNHIMDSYLPINVSPEKVDYDTHRLLKMAINRHKVALAEQMLQEANEASDPNLVDEILSDHISQLANIGHVQSESGVMEIDVIDDLLSGKIEEETVIPTASQQLNQLLGGGLRSSSLITVAGAAGVGKTGFATWLMDAIGSTQCDKQSIFFSLEMKPSEIVQRHLGVKASNLYRNLSEEERANAISVALQSPLRLYDYRACDLDFILTTCKLCALKQPISVIVVDYLTLVVNRGTFERNDLRQADTTSKLARLAHELDCIVIALSQVNRAAANREDQCPMPHDAADSSGSHRSSALWLGIDRPELYDTDPCYRDQFVIKCRKNRYGGNFEYVLSFNEGAFKEVPFGYFHKPVKKSKEEKIFEPSYKPHHGQ